MTFRKVWTGISCTVDLMTKREIERLKGTKHENSVNIHTNSVPIGWRFIVQRNFRSFTAQQCCDILLTLYWSLIEIKTFSKRCIYEKYKTNTYKLKGTFLWNINNTRISIYQYNKNNKYNDIYITVFNINNKCNMYQSPLQSSHLCCIATKFCMSLEVTIHSSLPDKGLNSWSRWRLVLMLTKTNTRKKENILIDKIAQHNLSAVIEVTG